MGIGGALVCCRCQRAQRGNNRVLFGFGGWRGNELGENGRERGHGPDRCQFRQNGRQRGFASADQGFEELPSLSSTEIVTVSILYTCYSERR